MKVDITRKMYQKRVALKNIHLDFPAGRTSLIIGTSGAGKSTLIKCMIGSTSFEGIISDYQHEDIAYIPQFPALNTQETAYDAIYWSARFSRLYDDRKDLQHAVSQHIDAMGLQGVQGSVIKRLSGGQKQRVSIAKELIRGKDIIIADEIDTGLDCGVSRDLVSKLCEITHQAGKTTIIISHNIVNIEMYDQVIVLAKGSDGAGGIAYAGSPAHIREFFSVSNYVDILTRVNAQDEGGQGQADHFIRAFSRICLSGR